MPDENTEIELKLEIVKGAPRHVRKAIGNVRLAATPIEDVYFDTPDAELRRRGIVLRLRRDGDKWLQTLKAGTNGKALVPARGEWEVVLAAGKDPPALDLERFDVAPLRLLMRGGLDTRALAPVFRTRIVRRRGELIHGRSRIEVALDRGELRARVDGRRQRADVAELELELKSGYPDDLIDAAAAIVRRRGKAALVPAMRSKAERGYALAVSRELTVERASARSFGEGIHPGMSAAEVLRSAMRRGIAVVVANSDALRRGPSSEHTHQARVALRRMRSAVRLLDPDGADFPSSLYEDLHWLARRLGEARDWDVIVEDTLPSIIASAGSPDAVKAKLARAAAQRRDRSVRRAVAAVSSSRYARLVLGLARWAASPVIAAGSPIKESATTLLDESARSLFKDARRFAHLGRHDRHRVRIRAKRLRYALDLLAVALPTRAASDYVAALAELQGSLGDLNDAIVARAGLGSIASHARDARAVDAWFERTSSLLIAQAARQLLALARRPQPWVTGPA